MNKNTMMERVYQYFAIDYNCSPNDFLEKGFIFTPIAVMLFLKE